MQDFCAAALGQYSDCCRNNGTKTIGRQFRVSAYYHRYGGYRGWKFAIVGRRALTSPFADLVTFIAINIPAIVSREKFELCCLSTAATSEQQCSIVAHTRTQATPLVKRPKRYFTGRHIGNGSGFIPAFTFFAAAFAPTFFVVITTTSASSDYTHRKRKRAGMERESGTVRIPCCRESSEYSKAAAAIENHTPAASKSSSYNSGLVPHNAHMEFYRKLSSLFYKTRTSSSLNYLNQFPGPLLGGGYWR